VRCSIFLFLIALSAAGAARAELLLAPESSTLTPGGRIEVTLFVANNSAEERSFDVPPRLTLRPRGRTDSPVVVLEATEPQPAQVRLAPGAFHRAHYSGTLSEGLTGEIVLEPVDFKGQPLAFIAVAPTVAPSGEERPPAPAEGSSPAQTPAPGAELDPEASRFTSAFSSYEPNYFSAGSSGPTNARFQVSFKFRFFNPNTKTPFLEQIFFGYSQSSIWDLSSASKSFRDSSYRPSLFYLNDSISQWKYRQTKLASNSEQTAGLRHLVRKVAARKLRGASREGIAEVDHDNGGSLAGSHGITIAARVVKPNNVFCAWSRRFSTHRY